MNAEQEHEAFELEEREALELEQRVRAVVAPYFGTVNALPALTGILIEHAMYARSEKGRTGNPAQVARLVMAIVTVCLETAFKDRIVIDVDGPTADLMTSRQGLTRAHP